MFSAFSVGYSPVFSCHIFQNAENLDCLTFDYNIL